MSKIASLNPVTFTPDSREVLEEAIEEDYESVIVFEFYKDTIAIKISKIKSTLEVIGAIEAAKQQLWGS